MLMSDRTGGCVRVPRSHSSSSATPRLSSCCRLLDDVDRFVRNKAAEILIEIGFISEQIAALNGTPDEAAAARYVLAAVVRAEARATLAGSVEGADPTTRDRPGHAARRGRHRRLGASGGGVSHTTQIIYALLMSYFVTLNVSTLGFISSRIGENRMRRRQAEFTDFARLERSHATVALSVIVPAFNEEAIMRDTVLSILGSTHPQFEVLVVNDGSTDDTLDVLRESLRPRAARRVLSPADRDGADPGRSIARAPTPTCGSSTRTTAAKADACNAGVNIAYHPYILQTDADCIFEPDTLIKVVRAINFDPRRTVAIGGQLRPGNGLIVSRRADRRVAAPARRSSPGFRSSST